MTLKIYGYPQSRTFRALWIAEEIRAVKGLDYELDGRVFSTPPAPEDVSTWYRDSVNPMGKVPTIQTSEITLTESMAITTYLAKKHDVLAPKDLEEEAKVLQWSFWVMTEMEAATLTTLKYVVGFMGIEKDLEKAKEHAAELERPLKVLEKHLANSTFLLGDDFTIADLNVASVLSWAQGAQVDMTDYPHVVAWLGKCLGRPAVNAARQAS